MILKMNKFLRTYLLLSITVWSAAPVLGQSDLKRNLETEDYHLWHKMVPREMASDGNWISFNLYYKHQSDSLVVKNTKNDKIYKLPGVRKHAFSENSHWFVYTDNNNSLGIIDLMNDNVEKIIDATDFKYSGNNNYLAVAITPEGRAPQLWIKNFQTGRDFTIDSVYEYEFSNNVNALLIAQKTELGHRLKWVDLNNPNHFKVIRQSVVNPFRRLTWSEDDKSLVVLEEFTMSNNEKNHFVHRLKNLDKLDSWETFDPLNFTEKTKYMVSNSLFSTLSISKDSKNVFFHLHEIEEKDEIAEVVKQGYSSTVQVWNASDRFVYPAYQVEKQVIHNPSLLTAWNPNANKLTFLGNTNYAETVLSPNQKYSVAFSNFDYRPHYKHHGKFTDVYRFDVDTGKSKLLLKKITYSPRLFYYAPSGNYLTYFKEGIWWLYDFKNDTHTNLTGSIPYSFRDTSKSGYDHQLPIGRPAWTPDEKAVLLTDGFDVWKIEIDSNQKTRLTNGREQNISYQIYDIAESHHNNNLFKGFVSDYLIPENKMILKAKGDDEKTGYFFLDEKGLHTITYDDSYMSHLKKGKNTNTIVYMKQKYDMPPRLISTSFENVQSGVIYQSNPQHYNYNWGHAELMEYTAQDGTPLKGALFYPANFDRNKKYPVIVHIYEIKSDEIHHYQNPSLYESAWYSFSNFTTEGYFVYFPDIIYHKKGPGLSALNSVNAAMDELIKKPFIDKENIGLTGHSFGGYQTCFIISQTDRFKTAVAGSSATNMLSFYLSMAWMWNRSQTWRFETQQWRFGKSYFEIPEVYEQNSPIHHAQNINTPLLTWTGDKDTNVNWEQSVELYNALRRLNKEHKFLLYPNEGHSVIKKENQMDLTIRIREWFEHYLKGKEPAAWMINHN
jgi:dipeptidyl aminopeptidase/acylaminoacyl peptidase